jgi:uncharacterized protein YgiM (DUF1202 family)
MNKRILAFLLILGILAATLIPCASAYGMVKYVYTRNGKPVNVRSQPSINSALVGTIAFGKAVTVENYTTDYTWAVITFNGRTAYVMSQYLVDGTPVNPVTPSSSGGGSISTQNLINSMENEFRSYRVVSPYTVLAKPTRASGWVNLRYAPSTEFGHAGNLYANTQLTVIAETTNWLQVRRNDNGVTGYVMRQYTISMGAGSGYLPADFNYSRGE